MVKWDKPNSPHPHLFGPKLNNNEKKYITDSVKKNNAFFGRKFDYDENNDIEKFVMKIIK